MSQSQFVEIQIFLVRSKSDLSPVPGTNKTGRFGRVLFQVRLNGMVMKGNLQRLAKGSEFFPVDLVTNSAGFHMGRFQSQNQRAWHPFRSASASRMIMESLPPDNPTSRRSPSTIMVVIAHGGAHLAANLLEEFFRLKSVSFFFPYATFSRVSKLLNFKRLGCRLFIVEFLSSNHIVIFAAPLTDVYAHSKDIFISPVYGLYLRSVLTFCSGEWSVCPIYRSLGNHCPNR